MAETKRKTERELRGEYEALAARCAGFDAETRDQLRRQDAEQKKWAADRKAARAALLRQKAAAFAALQQLQPAAERK